MEIVLEPLRLTPINFSEDNGDDVVDVPDEDELDTDEEDLELDDDFDADGLEGADDSG